MSQLAYPGRARRDAAVGWVRVWLRDYEQRGAAALLRRDDADLQQRPHFLPLGLQLVRNSYVQEALRRRFRVRSAGTVDGRSQRCVNSAFIAQQRGERIVPSGDEIALADLRTGEIYCAEFTGPGARDLGRIAPEWGSPANTTLFQLLPRKFLTYVNIGVLN